MEPESLEERQNPAESGRVDAGRRRPRPRAVAAAVVAAVDRGETAAAAVEEEEVGETTLGDGEEVVWVVASLVSAHFRPINLD